MPPRAASSLSLRLRQCARRDPDSALLTHLPTRYIRPPAAGFGLGPGTVLATRIGNCAFERLCGPRRPHPSSLLLTPTCPRPPPSLHQATTTCQDKSTVCGHAWSSSRQVTAQPCVCGSTVGMAAIGGPASASCSNLVTSRRPSVGAHQSVAISRWSSSWERSAWP